jgi:RHS repeat-associated protein
MDLVRRTVWDGFQELVEIQQPGGDGEPVAVLENDTTPLRRGAPDGIDQNPLIGRVLYTYGAVLDQPLSLIRVGYADTTASTPTPQPWFMWQPFSILPLWSYLGEVDRSMFGIGANPCQMVNGVQRCVLGAWPLGWSALQVPEFIPYFWHGTVTENKRDKAQTLYKRYRLYDPLTGRFTQEDPIGLAGGLNLYGFASGDPVNFTDPFGLETYVNCRQVGGTGSRGIVGHCAIRVIDKERGIDKTIELIPDKKRKNRVHFREADDDAVKAYDPDNWVQVAAPEGTSSQAFDDAVLGAARSEKDAREGKTYWPWGHTNSNNFVYSVITQAGGVVPRAPASGFLFKAPGLCGGRWFATGDRCSK